MTLFYGMKGKDTVFVSQLERFGYTMMAVGHTKKEAEDAVLADYYKAYMDYNDGAKPDEDWLDDSSTYWSVAKDEIYTEEMEYGKVVWC